MIVVSKIKTLEACTASSGLGFSTFFVFHPQADLRDPQRNIRLRCFAKPNNVSKAASCTCFHWCLMREKRLFCLITQILEEVV